jgi:hypothetical protein
LIHLYMHTNKTVFNRIHTDLMTLLTSVLWKTIHFIWCVWDEIIHIYNTCFLNNRSCVCLFLCIRKNILKTPIISFNAKNKNKTEYSDSNTCMLLIRTQLRCPRKNWRWCCYCLFCKWKYEEQEWTNKKNTVTRVYYSCGLFFVPVRV